MPKRLTQCEFESRARAIHGTRYEYGIYGGSGKKIEIICKLHGRVMQWPAAILKGMGCTKCTNRYTISTQEFIERAREVHGDRYEYGVYTNTTTNITITCATHGAFDQLPSNHLNGFGCPSCTGNKRLTQEEFEERAKLIHGNRYEYGKFTSTGKCIDITCQHHGIFAQSASQHLRGDGCPKCANKHVTQLEFIEKAHKVHGNIYEYGTYSKALNKIKIICPVHGPFDQIANDHLNGFGCPRCTTTGYSNLQIEWLDYITQKEGIGILHAYNACEFKIPGIGKVDGYCESTNTVYEFHGDYWHGHPSKYDASSTHPVTKKTYGELYNSTLLRDQKIRDYGYNLVVIWEHEWNTIKN